MDDLSDRQRTALWYRAQGFTAAAIARRMSTPESPLSAAGAQDLLHKCNVKLRSRDTTHSVFLAMTHGLIGPYLDCGTRRAWLRHIRRQQQTCIACRKANTEYVRTQRDAVPEPDPDAGNNRGRVPLPITPNQLRVLRAMRDGATDGPSVGRALGITEGYARRLINQIMERFGIDSITYAKSLTYGWAVDEAKRRGLLD